MMSTTHNLSKSRLRLSLTGTAIFILIFIKGVHYIILWETPCYNSDVGDALPSAEDPSFVPGAKSIFFHETSCRGGLSIRQACSVEAAARAHPQLNIHVLFSSPVTNNTLKTSCLAKLLEFPNVKFLRVHIAEFSKGTAVQSILLNNLRNSVYPIQHAADILRIVTLNKWGGIYLDTDMIVTRSLEHLPLNFVAKENQIDVASGILSFAKDEIGANITNEVMKIISEEFSPTRWSTIGAGAIDQVLHRSCSQLILSPNYRSNPISNCNGVTVFDYELFYPHYFSDLDEIFSPPTEQFDLARPYTYHMWDFLTHNRSIQGDTVYEIIAKAFCPTIHNTYKDEFFAKIQSTITSAIENTTTQ